MEQTMTKRQLTMELTRGAAGHGEEEERAEVGAVLSGLVVGWGSTNCRVNLDGGTEAVLGTNHLDSSRKARLLRRGARVGGLRVEGVDEMGRVRVTGHELHIE